MRHINYVDDSIAVTLPDKLSELIRVAAADARGLSRDVYHPHYLSWHSPILAEDDTFMDRVSRLPTARCQVCFAGSLLAGLESVKPDELWMPGRTSISFAAKMHALDWARNGSFMRAVECLGYMADDDMNARYPMPCDIEFEGWDEFDRFLDSIVAISYLLESDGF